MSNRYRTITVQVPAADYDPRRLDSEAAREERNARRKLGQIERFRDLDAVEDEFRKIFCFARTAGDTITVVDALEIIREICRARLGLPGAAPVIVEEIPDADVDELEEVANG